MAIATNGNARGYLTRAPSPSGLVDVIDVILDKGLVIDAYVRVSVIGIEVLTIDARIVIASVDTYLRFAEATNRMDLTEDARSVVDLLDEGVEKGVAGVATSVADKKTEGALDKVEDTLGRPARDLTRAAGEKVLEVAEGLSKDT